MRLKITRARSRRTAQWQEVFAWLPVKVDGTWVWLEALERRYVWHRFDWHAFQSVEYRIPKDYP